jgi:hypothetical protein
MGASRLIAIQEYNAATFGCELCYATVAGVEYVAIRLVATGGAARDIHIDGFVFGDTAYPQIVADADVTAVTTISAAERLHTSLTLPDEYGEFVTSITCSIGGTVTLNSSYDTLAYRKLGNQATVHGEIRVSSVSSPNGAFDVALPFAAAALTDGAEVAGIGLMVTNVVAANIADFVGYVPNGASYIRIELGDSNTSQIDSANELTAGSIVRFVVTYRTA